MSITNLLPERTDRIERTERMIRTVLPGCLAALVAVAACGTDGMDSQNTPCTPPANSTAPTYTELFTRYFAQGTPGHCATAECHFDSSNGWACGTSKDTCYAGMLSVDLINPGNPKTSVIGDPKNSPLRWINPNGPMPQDAAMAFPEGRDAILAWVAACAQNN
jgi:hypothetical protein